MPTQSTLDATMGGPNAAPPAKAIAAKDVWWIRVAEADTITLPILGDQSIMTITAVAVAGGLVYT